MTSLTAATPLGRRYLSWLHRVHEVAAPGTTDQLLRDVQAAGTDRLQPHTIEREGSMVYIAGRVSHRS